MQEATAGQIGRSLHSSDAEGRHVRLVAVQWMMMRTVVNIALM